MAATTKKKKFTRKNPIRVEMVDVTLPDVYDEPLTVPAFASFPAKRLRQFARSDDAMFEAIAEHADEDVVEALNELAGDELTEFVKRWRQAGSLSAPKSKG